MNVAVAHLSLPMMGELANGDRAVWRSDEARRTLFAVIDGLGHGPDASAAAQAAVECLQALSLDAPLHDMMEAVHDRLSGSRGAAATVCIVRARALEVRSGER